MKRVRKTSLPYGEQKKRDEMFQGGFLWCTSCKQFHPVKDFKKYGRVERSNYGYRYYCYRCEVKQYKDRADRHSAFFKERNDSLKKQWVELAGEKCQRCGFREFQSALDFHHVYPATKKGNPSVLIFSNNKEKTWKELDKCCLLCSICHRAYKAREWRAEFLRRGDGLLGYTVGSPLPLDDNRYETEKPPKYNQSPMPLFTNGKADIQLSLFG